ncbi:MAG: hypothetical protein E7468_07055 [Ruminococcaceae bacterium]|nr:hypothetical protein [Oscillospiraceae bacterium]
MEENTMKRNIKSVFALVLCLVLVVGVFAGCKEEPVKQVELKQAAYNTTTKVMPSNWNEFTYADNNDTQIMSYIGSSFFEYDYKFEGDKKYNADGSVNKAGIVPGAYTTNYSAATKLEDVTSLVDAKWGYTAEQKEEGGYAWKITLRDDLKWDDGTSITAADFEWSMQQLLDPKFMNFRANTYYDTLMIKNSKDYFFSGAPIYAPIVPAYGEGETPDYSFDMNSNEVYMSVTDAGMTLAPYSLNTLINDYVGSAEAKAALKVIADAANEYGYTLITEDNMEAAKELISYALKPFGLDWSSMDAAAQNELFMETLFYVSGYGDEVEWDTVGIYAVEGENAIVLCLDKAYSFLKEDGSLSVWAPYYFSSLPVVHKAKYEASKIAPAEGATLWTSNYNSSLATTASWGPYKLVEFEAGSHYKLEKNEYWYGWNLEQYKNQYNITAINCRKVEEASTSWMGFLNGEYDDAVLDNDNVAEYLDSKYVYFTSTSTGTFGMQLYSNLDVLKNSENNNGILAIQEFRHAFNLALNRSDIVEKIWPGSSVPCFGLLNVAYYYDIENSPDLEDGGQYRNTTIAKEGILRAYGFTQNADGKWSSGDLKDLSTDDAYDALTGYNPTLAKEKMKEAIAILTADPAKYGYDATKDITLIYGSSVDNDKQRFRAEYVQGILNDLTKGTSLEGKIKVVFDASAGNKWSEAFRSGATQIGFGYGFSGNGFNPFDIVGAFVNPDDSLNYHMYWDTSAIDLTLTMPAGDYEGAGETITMSVQNWYFCLNGLAETEDQAKTYNWGEGFAPVEARLMILSALEELVIKESRSVMLIADSGGSFLGAKFSYFSEDEHTFMGFGGIRYMEVNYTDAEWDAFVAANNNNLANEYKKSE